ncbi:methyltransferase [Terrimonas sp. NA20]|uniref:tRNA1(Val) (adenine(37)-N6)-methyltransferase n=1 Tax=Terrimonas ginsenosidimutans TaxID=2908004 RepID=A0ABS9KSY3_9BACT|nr:methyltransferase [Terrimonas ginsenosidimutans]MCG2615414.1 methyltransferase [Terrimonas ginsenosidimutans]
MANSYFRFKQFTVHQELAAMKVTTDSCLFGAWTAAQLDSQSPVTSILDIGTGTGLLSLMLAQKYSAHIDAIEIDGDAATQAEKNFAQSPWSDRLQMIHQDVHQFTPSHSYDVIISNPPFYENDLTGTDSKKNIAHHDSGLLLDDLIKIITNKLTPGNGSFFLLMPEKRLSETLSTIRQHQLQTYKICRVRQSVGHGFFRVLIYGGNQGNETSPFNEELSIRNSHNEYTDEFVALLKDYYLYL